MLMTSWSAGRLCGSAVRQTASIASKQFGDRQVGIEFNGGQLSATGQPFTDQSIVFDLAGLRAVRAEVAITAIESDDGLTGSTMFPVLGNRILELGMVQPRFPEQLKTVCTVLVREKRAALPNTGR